MRIAIAFRAYPHLTEKDAAVFFYWEDCSDNTIAATSGDTLLVSGGVVDVIKVNLIDAGVQFPTHRGTLPECLGTKADSRILPQVVFRNGGVQFPGEVMPAVEDTAAEIGVPPGDSADKSPD